MIQQSDIEKSILQYIARNVNATPREIAQSTGTDEKTARRIYNRLFAENICSQMIIPNFAILGFNVMIIQRLTLKSSKLPDISFISSSIRSRWPNCIDCHETFDGKLFVRSIWKSSDDFKRARTSLHNRQSLDWLHDEKIDMVPLDEKKEFINTSAPWQES